MMRRNKVVKLTPKMLKALVLKETLGRGRRISQAEKYKQLLITSLYDEWVGETDRAEHPEEWEDELSLATSELEDKIDEAIEEFHRSLLDREHSGRM